MCALGVLRGLCTYLWVCIGGVEGDVCIAMCVRWGVLRGMCEYLRVCAGGVEGDVYIPTGVHLGC